MNIQKEEYNLSDGVPVIYSFDDTNALIQVNVFFDLGSIDEPVKKQGVRNLSAGILSKGAKGMTRDEIARGFESLGALYGVSTGEDYTSFSLSSTLEKLPQALFLFFTVLCHPDFPKDEFEKEKFLVLQGIKSKEEDIFSVASDDFKNKLFGKENHYGRNVEGALESVSKIKIKEIKDFYSRYFIKENMFFVVTGNIRKEKINSFLEKYLGDFRSGKSKKNEYIYEPLAGNISGINRKIFFQAFLITGSKAPGVLDKDYFPLKIVSTVLGGNMSSRLFRKLREEQGLAYAVGTGYPTKKYESSFFSYIGLDKKNIDTALTGIKKELENLRNEGITEEELEYAKTYMKTALLFSYQSKSTRAWYFGFWKIMGCPLDFDMNYIENVEKVTIEDIKNAINKLLNQKIAESIIVPEK